jgi:excisionase family DNA binding protein
MLFLLSLSLLFISYPYILSRSRRIWIGKEYIVSAGRLTHSANQAHFRNSRMNDPLLSLEEAASYLHVSKTSLRRWTNEGRLECVRVGKRAERRFRTSDIQRFVSTRTAGEKEMSPRGALDAAAAQGVPRHVSLHYRNRDELWRLFGPHVVDHLRRAAPLIYIHDEGARGDVLERLGGEGFDVTELERQGLLRLLVPGEAYLRTGSFSAKRMIDFIESAILDRRALGYTVMLVSGDMAWCLSGAHGVEEMIPYETALNELLARYPDVTIICNYDMMRVPTEIHFGALCAHPHTQVPDRFVQGFYRGMDK